MTELKNALEDAYEQSIDLLEKDPHAYAVIFTAVIRDYVEDAEVLEKTRRANGELSAQVMRLRDELDRTYLRLADANAKAWWKPWTW